MFVSLHGTEMQVMVFGLVQQTGVMILFLWLVILLLLAVMHLLNLVKPSLIFQVVH